MNYIRSYPLAKYLLYVIIKRIFGIDQSVPNPNPSRPTVHRQPLLVLYAPINFFSTLIYGVPKKRTLAGGPYLIKMLPKIKNM